MVCRSLSVAAFAALLTATPCLAQTVSNGPYYATPSWDQKLQCDTIATCPRFVVLANFNSQAVLDRETGLVWEREPNVFPFDQPQNWQGALFECVQKNTGGRKGWRLPTIDELSSLIDEGGDLPAGHPFIGVQHFNPSVGLFANYWSSTIVPPNQQFAFIVGFGGFATGQQPLTTTNFFWCVRGPGGVSY